MSRTSLIAATAILVLAATGCGNRIVGHSLKEEGQWFGELGITGHLNEITIRSRSEITKLSIIGDANHVVVEDRTILAKIEVWGENNRITIPAALVVRINQWGKGTEVIRRPPPEARVTAPPTAEYVPPTEPEVAEEPVVKPRPAPAVRETEAATEPNAVPE